MISKALYIIRLLFNLCLLFAPMQIKRLIYNNFFACSIDKSARIGFSLLQNTKLKMGPKAVIGNFCFIKNLKLLELENNATVGNFTRMTAQSVNSKRNFVDEPERYPSLKLGQYSSIVGGGHYFDCNNTITIGQYSIVAGRGSSFFTHGVDIKDNKQKTAKIHIGNYTIVSAGCIVLKGAKLPDFSVLGANSTLHKSYSESYYLYSGVPAMPLKKLNQNSLFFSRTKGFVP